MINLDKDTCCPDDSTCCSGVAQDVVTADLKLTSTRTSEILTTQFGDMSADSRVTLKRITNSSRSISSGKQISFVHSSTVTTTWSGSRPSVEGLTVDKDGHAVLGFDLFNKIPRSGDLFGWVNNLDSLIKDQNVGSEKEQVSTDNSGAADQHGQGNAAAVDCTLNNEAGEEKNQNRSTYKGAAGTEFLDIAHEYSFSQMEAIN